MERVADYVIRKLYEEGAEHIFLVSGRGILYLTDAVAKNKEITPISLYHEQSASYAALAYASAKLGISACLISTGCASTNSITACLCAYQDSIPVVFISGNSKLSENTRHTKSAVRTYGSQETDIIELVSPITKYATMIEKSENVVIEVEKALYYAKEGRKGPVWLDIPLDVQNMRIDEEHASHFFSHKGKERDFSEEVSFVSQRLNEASRPIILVGGGARSAKEEIKILVEKSNIPLVCSPTASDILGSAFEYSIGTVGSIGGSRAGNFSIQNSDFVLVIGSKLSSQLTGKSQYFAREAKLVIIDIDHNEHQKKRSNLERLINLDAKVFLKELIKSNLKSHSMEWIKKCVSWKEKFSLRKEMFLVNIIKENRIDIYSLIDVMNDFLLDDATIITDAGFEELIVPASVRFRAEQRCLFSASQGAMGYAIPAIIGAYEANRKNIICIVGDGSIMMNIQELQIITFLKIPVKILVISNDMYAVIRRRQKDLFRNRTIGNDPCDGLPKPEFSEIAKGFGFSYKKINDREELLSYLPYLNDGKTEMVEICCDSNQEFFHESFEINERRKLIFRPIEDMSPFLPRELIEKEMIVKMIN